MIVVDLAHNHRGKSVGCGKVRVKDGADMDVGGKANRGACAPGLPEDRAGLRAGLGRSTILGRWEWRRWGSPTGLIKIKPTVWAREAGWSALACGLGWMGGSGGVMGGAGRSLVSRGGQRAKHEGVVSLVVWPPPMPDCMIGRAREWG